MGSRRILIVGLALIAGLVSCRSATKVDAERAALHMQIGTGYLAQGQYPQAMRELLKAEELDPKNPRILNNLGLALYVRGRVQKAEEKFRAAIKEDPNFAEAKNNLARMLIEQKKLKEALNVLHEVEMDLTYMYPEKTLAHLGLAYFEMGQFQKAEQYLLRSLQLRRQNCLPAHYYGRTLQETNRPAQAAKALDQAVEFCRTSKFEEPLFFSAMSYFSLGEKEKTRARLEELLKDYPKSKFVAKAKGMLELLEQ